MPAYMGRLKDLLMFANPADFRRAVSNPQKAVRVLKSIILQTSSSIEKTDAPEEKLQTVIPQILDCSEENIKGLFQDAEDFEKNQIKPKLAEFSDLSFSPGGMSIGGKALYVITRVVKPQSILEIGVANGMSTAYILGALNDENMSPESVTIHAIDRPQFAYQIRERRGKFGIEGRGGLIPDNKEVGWLAPNDIKSNYNYQLHIGDFTHILEDILETSGNLDLAVYDASKDSDEMKFAYQRCINKLNGEGVLISDDVLVNDTFENMIEPQDGKFNIINDTGIYRNVRLS
jgi:predicted O-methyltransferase YrrM